MKYTPSEDGIDRVNIRITLRFTAEEIAEIKRLARKAETDWRTWLESHAALGIEGGMLDGDGTYLQHYEEGDV